MCNTCLDYSMKTAPMKLASYIFDNYVAPRFKCTASNTKLMTRNICVVIQKEADITWELENWAEDQV